MKQGVESNMAKRVSGMIVVVLAVVVFAGFAGPVDADFFFKINKSIDIFGRVYKEIATNYVDEVDPEKFMSAGIEGMLGTLDPYTVYIEKQDGDEVELLTSGKYGGIGVTIGQRDGNIQVISVMEGYSAQRQGVLPGDKIIEVDGVKVTSRKPDEVRSLTRGEPGTQVKVLIGREGEPEPILFDLLREEVQIKNVTYSGYVEDGIAYIRLERFSRKAGDELRQAIRELKLKGEIKGLVLDVRGNPGGLLDAAVDIVSKFVPRGSLIVSTKGRRVEAEKQYTSVEEPMLPATPLVILTDRNSASASEIVSGALQDLDRGLVVGTRTFGKGLVQTILPLSYGAQLKITTARYYTPSGRSIQEIDYIQRDKGRVFSTYADSLKQEFTTRAGRKVYGYGGVTPDSVVDEVDPGPMVRQLYRKSMFVKFSNKYVAEHKDREITGMTDATLEEFRKFLEDRQFDFQEESETKIQELRSLAENLHYSKEVLSDLDALKTDLEKEKKRGFERYRNHIRTALDIELMARIKGEQGRIEASLKDDVQLAAGLALLKSPSAYARKIHP